VRDPLFRLAQIVRVKGGEDHLKLVCLVVFYEHDFSVLLYHLLLMTSIATITSNEPATIDEKLDSDSNYLHQSPGAFR